MGGGGCKAMKRGTYGYRKYEKVDTYTVSTCGSSNSSLLKHY